MPHPKIALLLLLAAPAYAQSAPAHAQNAPAEAPPRAVRALLECRTLTDAAARLACFDREAATLGGALESREVVVADREEVRDAKRKLFGLTLPSMGLFAGADDDKAKVDEIEAAIVSARIGPDRKWRLVLDNESRWTQTDTMKIQRDPKPGMMVRIRKAAGGSFFANVDGQTAIRMVRVN